MMRYFNLGFVTEFLSAQTRKQALLAGLIGSAFFAPSMQGQVAYENGIGPFKTQTIELRAGWNAVYLEIEPTAAEPNAFFADTPIEIAAAYYRPATSMEFFESPTDFLGDRKSWSVWYAPDRDDALLSNLYRINAHTAYLIFSKEDYTWQVDGVSFFGSVKWHPNAYNLVGFSVAATELPTVEQFFDGADAHAPLKIYEMINGTWTLIVEPAEKMIQPGVAYWAYSESASEFSGPLKVEFSNEAAGGVIFTGEVSTQEIQLTNVAGYPQNLNFSLEAGAAGQIPLEYVVRALDGPNQPIESMGVTLPASQDVGPLEPGQAFKFVLRVDQSAITAPITSTNLVITSDAGSRVVVPMICIRRDLMPQ